MNNNMKKIAFCVPCCSYNRIWEKIYESLLTSLFLSTLQQNCPDFQIDIYIGYNDDDKLFNNHDNQMLVSGKMIEPQGPEITIKWFKFNKDYKGKPTHIWNKLTEYAYNDNHDYFFCCGDDIMFPQDNGWIGEFIKTLKKNDNKGIAGGDSGNPNLPMTQFFFHRKHFEINGFVFPPAIHNWFCDNWILEVYSEKHIHYFPQYKFLNLGGEPRYKPNDDRKLCSLLVKRHKADYN